MVFTELCPPALIYLIFSVTQIAIDTVQGMYNTAFAKVWVTMVFTIVLNFLCSRGLGIISWLLVFIPFMLMTLIIGILLYMFGLDPRTGRLMVYAHSKQFKSDEEAYARRKRRRHHDRDDDDDYYHKKRQHHKARHHKGHDSKSRCGKKYNYDSKLADKCDHMSPGEYEFHQEKCRINKQNKYKYDKCIDKDSKYSYDNRHKKHRKHTKHHDDYNGYHNHRHHGKKHDHARYGDENRDKNFNEYNKNLDWETEREHKKLKEKFSLPKWPALQLPSLNISAPLIKFPSGSIALDAGSIQLPIPTAVSMGCMGGCD